MMKKNLFLLTSLVSLSMGLNAQMGNFSDPVRMGSGVNTEAEETMPVFSPDSSILYFARSFDPTNTGGVNDQDIWSSKRDGMDYANAEKPKGVNNKYNNAVVGISKDGKSMYVLDSYEGKKDLVKGCAVSRLKGDSWGEPEHIDIPTLDINGDFFGFHVDESETVMIISYEGPGTLGGEDLFVCTKNGTAWSAPVHMGMTINTAGFEISPFLSKSMDTLFFASNGLGGEGDADIFYSVRQNNSWTDWSTPVNLGPKINSTKYDAFFTYSSNKVYWVSNRESERSDIYWASILPPPPPPPVSCSGVGTDVTVYRGTDGKIDLTVEGGLTPYEIIWSNNTKSEDIDGLVRGEYTAIITDAVGQTCETTITINEPPIKDIAPLLVGVNPIYFDLGKYNIRKDAAKELDKIVKIMNDNPTLEIELGSHTDCQAGAEYNMKLSDNRAKASAAYIQKRITNPSRINGRGYGESQLKVDCPCEGEVKSKCTDKEHQLNRRTEFVLRGQGQSASSGGNTTASSGSSTSGSNTDTEVATTEKPKKEKVVNSGKFKTDIPVSEEQKANIANGFYIVQEGETLYRVSVNTKVSTDQLRKINNLKSNNLKPGTKLLIR